MCELLATTGMLISVVATGLEAFWQNVILLCDLPRKKADKEDTVKIKRILCTAVARERAAATANEARNMSRFLYLRLKTSTYVCV